ncbi:thioredoxin family protein [Desulfosporosinus sp. BG]|uniref:thioredoxin family protein n=1 Tax=Desulfosporosinus sp. BG TaxID=1633135 RepID=UPI00083AADE8|nr:thioredoxin family protein [Desulfosporosinus sp. BG]ODA38907.1 redox-active disulfide protein 2 [Desulfosporosinus sp. BG]
MEIKVLGTGCKKCKQLEELVKEVVKETKTEAVVIKVTDIQEIAKAGIMLTPGLMIDGKVKSTGKVPSKADLVKLITESALK